MSGFRFPVFKGLGLFLASFPRNDSKGLALRPRNESKGVLSFLRDGSIGLFC